jgi:hypothetical protein
MPRKPQRTAIDAHVEGRDLMHQWEEPSAGDPADFPCSFRNEITDPVIPTTRQSARLLIL